MEFHQLRYFLAVARYRSFTRAAEHEHVAQPSLSQQIRKLEDEFGARLFDRLGRKIALTPLGASFLKRARRALEEVEGARQEATEMLGLRRGSVALGAIPTVAPYLLPRFLPAFRRSHPQIAVTVREDLTSALLAQLADGELDLALLSLPVRGNEFEATPLYTEAMVLAVPNSHPLGTRARRRVGLSDVAREPFLLLKDGHCFRDDVLEICRQSHLSPPVAFEGGQFDTLVAMVAAGAGITLLPEMACAHFRRRGVKLVELRPPRPTRTIGFVRAREKYLTPAARALIQILKETCAV
ncbi:MAG: LysR family transcriptional regulator [Acidobacteriia bacterium]|nr:LysR family transcriptional regulator [Terriglobia bacterium]